MAMKYCDEHQIWYDYNDTCPECTKFGRIAGNIIGGSIFAIGWAGKKIYDKIKENNVRTKEQQTATKNNYSGKAEEKKIELSSYDLCIKANALFNSEKYAEAIAYYDQGIKLYPNESVFWVNKGMSLEALKRYSEAIICYDQAIRLEPNNKTHRKFREKALAMNLGNQNYPDDIRSVIEKVITVSPHADIFPIIYVGEHSVQIYSNGGKQLFLEAVSETSQPIIGKDKEFQRLGFTMDATDPDYKIYRKAYSITGIDYIIQDIKAIFETIHNVSFNSYKIDENSYFTNR